MAGFTGFIAAMLLSFCLLPPPSMAKIEQQNFQPIIGVITQPTGDGLHHEIEASYVSFIEAGGGRAAPISMLLPDDEIYALFKSMNGVLFPGGGVRLSKGNRFYQVMENIFNWAIKENDEGRYYPIWGTCLGFQAIVEIVSQNYTILTDHAYVEHNVVHTVNWVASPEKLKASRILNLCNNEATLLSPTALSRLFGIQKQESPLMCIPGLFKATQTEPLAAYNHNDGVQLKEWYENQSLGQFFDMLATSIANDGTEFVTVIEGKKYPFYGVQFHPEKNIFLYSPKIHVTHSLHATQFSQYFASFLINEARKSKNRFPTKSQEYNSLIFKYPQTIRSRSSDPYDVDVVYLFHGLNYGYLPHATGYISARSTVFSVIPQMSK